MPPTTQQFQQGETASGVAQAAGLTPAQFLELNPNLAATGLPNDYQGLTGLVKVGQSYNLGPKNQLVVSAAPANAEFASYSNDLQTMLSGLNQPTSATTGNNVPGSTTTTDVDINNVSKTDPYARMLDTLGEQSNASTKALIASIQASRMNQQNSVNTQYDNYKRGLQLLGIQHNDAQSTPDLLMGHIQVAENEQRAKIEALDREEKKLLMDAETARTKNNLELLKEKVNRVKEIKQEKQDALKRIADNLAYETKISETHAHQIYNQLSKLSDTEKEKFLQAAAKKWNVSLSALVSAVADEKQKRDDEDFDRKMKRQKAIVTATKATNKVTKGKPLATGQKQTFILSDDDATRSFVSQLEDLGVYSNDIIALQASLDAGYSIDQILAESNISKDAERLIRTRIATENAKPTSSAGGRSIDD